MFNQAEYELLHSIVFQDDYPGYTPDVTEAPNGDGKLDQDKRYAHVATKYLDRWNSGCVSEVQFLQDCLRTAHGTALRVASALNVPTNFFPQLEYGALRVLEYPPGSVSNEHEDFDMFTLMCYRDQPDRFVSDWHDMPSRVSHLNAQCHMGEIGELLGLGKATKHSVLPSDTWQHSIVYFCIPSHWETLPTGVTVGDWLKERLARSRLGPYKG